MLQGVIDAAKLAADNDLSLRISNRLSQFNLDSTALETINANFLIELNSLI